MSETSGADRRGIEIPDDVARAVGLPEDLDADAPVDYAVPDTVRRRRAAYVYAAVAAIAATAGALGWSTAFWWLAVAGVAIAAYHLASGTPLRVRERQALDTANRATEFAVGHASATVGFEGILARPVWNVLLFSADEPPTRRALVRIDAGTGDVVDTYEEDIDQD